MRSGSFYRLRLARRQRPRGCASGLWLALLALALPSGEARAQASAATAELQATVLEPGSMVNVADMDFGEIAQPFAPGTVTMSASANATCSVTGGLIRTGACQSAHFDGDVTWLYPLRVGKPAGNQITLTGPAGATMVIRNLTYAGSGMINWIGSTPTEQRYLVTSLDGNFTLFVGGTLEVAAHQRPGVYTGTLTLTFNYD